MKLTKRNMNPATAAQPMPRPMVNDIGPVPRPAPVIQARPAPAVPRTPSAPMNPAAAPNHPMAPAAPVRPPMSAPAAAPQQAVFTANLVTDLPVHNPQAAPAGGTVPEDAELDKIMRDVGHELKKDDVPDKKSHLSIFSRKTKPTTQVITSAPAAAPAAPQIAPAQSPPTQPAPVQQAAAPVKKTGHASSAPVMTILVTVMVAGLLAAAAFYSYK